MKAGVVPKHYTITCTPDQMRSLVMGFRTYCREYHVQEEDKEILSVLEEAYEGELGNPPGQPIEEAA